MMQITIQIENELIALGIPYTTLNGKQGMMDNKYARALKILKRMKSKDYRISQREIHSLMMVSTSLGKKLLSDKDFLKYSQSLPTHLINFRMNDATYYREVYNKIDKKPGIKLSTIHGAKGLEADNVVILNGISQRVVEGMEIDPDAESKVWFVAITRAKKNVLWVSSTEMEGYII